MSTIIKDFDLVSVLKSLSNILPIGEWEELSWRGDGATLVMDIADEDSRWYWSDDGTFKTKSVVMKLSTSNSELMMVHKLHRLAEGICPVILPKAICAGEVDLLGDGRLCINLSEFIADAVTLETVWDDWDVEAQNGFTQLIADAIVLLSQVSFNPENPHIVSELHKRLADSEYVGAAHEVASGSSSPIFQVPGRPNEETSGPDLNNSSAKTSFLRLGGPSMGYYDNTEEFLQAFLAFHNQGATSKIARDEVHGGVVITSLFQDWEDEDLRSVQLSASDLAWLYQHACFQHNDLEPRNILVKLDSDRIQYDEFDAELTAIIDWELAGFYPPGFEYAVKDVYLGCNNWHYSWYRVFKDRVGEALKLREAPSPQKKFMKAIALIMESDARETGRDFRKLARQKFIAREQIMRGKEIWEGWVRKSGAVDVKTYGEADNDRLEEEVLMELENGPAT